MKAFRKSVRRSFIGSRSSESNLTEVSENSDSGIKHSKSFGDDKNVDDSQIVSAPLVSVQSPVPAPLPVSVPPPVLPPPASPPSNSLKSIFSSEEFDDSELVSEKSVISSTKRFTALPPPVESDRNQAEINYAPPPSEAKAPVRRRQTVDRAALEAHRRNVQSLREKLGSKDAEIRESRSRIFELQGSVKHQREVLKTMQTQVVNMEAVRDQVGSLRAELDRLESEKRRHPLFSQVAEVSENIAKLDQALLEQRERVMAARIGLCLLEEDQALTRKLFQEMQVECMSMKRQLGLVDKVDSGDDQSGITNGEDSDITVSESLIAHSEDSVAVSGNEPKEEVDQQDFSDDRDVDISMADIAAAAVAQDSKSVMWPFGNYIPQLF